MKKILSFALVSAAFACAQTASAAEFTPADPNFVVFGNPFTGTNSVSAIFGNGDLSGTDTDNFRFTIGSISGDPIGLGSGAVTTSFSIGLPGAQTTLRFNSVTFNNGSETFIVPITAVGDFATINNVAIFAGVLNTLSVNYTATGNASYAGNLTFVPGGIPEPMTWAMMILGFAAIGFAMRRRSEEVERVRYAF